jgi:multidrug transporter EmrE-like cation transporter
VGYAYIALTILLTVFGQLILKWQVALAGPLPPTASAKAAYFLGLLFRPWILGAFAAAFLASIAWMAAMTKFNLSYAYPFMSLTFVLVLLLSWLLFHEPLSVSNVIGLLLIIAGIIVGSQAQRTL